MLRDTAADPRLTATKNSPLFQPFWPIVSLTTTGTIWIDGKGEPEQSGLLAAKMSHRLIRRRWERSRREWHSGLYTYLGQFVDHDITFDPASSLQMQDDPDALTEFPNSRLRSDNIYGPRS